MTSITLTLLVLGPTTSSFSQIGSKALIAIINFVVVIAHIQHYMVARSSELRILNVARQICFYQY